MVGGGWWVLVDELTHKVTRDFATSCSPFETYGFYQGKRIRNVDNQWGIYENMRVILRSAVFLWMVLSNLQAQSWPGLVRVYKRDRHLLRKLLALNSARPHDPYILMNWITIALCNGDSPFSGLSLINPKRTRYLFFSECHFIFEYFLLLKHFSVKLAQ